MRSLLAVASLTLAIIFGSAGSAHAAPIGGGCQSARSIAACISFASGTTNPLLGDFYYNYFEPEAAYAKVAIVVNGTTWHKYTTNLDHRGAYPVARHYVGGRGAAYTVVRVYDGYSRLLFVSASPNQYYG
jgi:hypothetical protein